MNFLRTTQHWIATHKKTSASIVIVLAIAGYAIARKADSTTGETRYVLAAVQTGTIVSSVSGSGQVAASNQIDIQPKVSGEITAVGVKAGQTVKAGDLIVEIDSRDAANALETSKLSLAKLLEVDPQTKLQDQNALDEEKQSLVQSYNDGRSAVAKAMLDLPSIANGLDALYNNGGYISYQKTSSTSDTTRATVDAANQSHTVAESSLQALTKEYSTLSQSTDTATTETLLNDTLATSQLFVQAVSDAQNAVELVAANDDQKNMSELTSTRSSLATWTNTATGDASSIQSTQSTLTKTKNTIEEDTETLADLVAGPDPLDIRSAQLDVQQKQEAYDDYFVRAPFDGVIASFTGQVGESASGTIGTLITQSQIATVTLNEVDVSKVAVGDKVTLTFDAIDGLSIAGEVAEIDAVGTVSQGVVTYTVQIGFDTQDDRVKPGMSVTASIITDSKADVLTVPNSAVKSANGANYVLVLDNPGAATAGVQGVTSVTPPRQVPVVVGLADGTSTEIVSGLTEGEQVVSKTVAPTTTAAATTAQAPSLLGGGAARGGAAAAGGARTFGR